MSKAPTDFNVIRFYSHFKKKVEAINKFPLSTDNLIIHNDLVKEVGDESLEFYYPFASLAMDRPRSFEDLLFSVELYNHSIQISIDQQYPVQLQYKDLETSEETFAQNLVDFLIGLANGQILLLQTSIEDEGQAVEILYKQKGAHLYTVARTFVFYTKASKQKDVEYNTTVRRNNVDHEEIAINKHMIGLVTPQTMTEEKSNRRPFADLNSPLIREVYNKSLDHTAEIWSQDWTAKWFPDYNKSKSKSENLVSFTHYRYIEVAGVVFLALIFLTLNERTLTENILYTMVVLLTSIVSIMHLRIRNRGKLLYGIIAYIVAIAYTFWFINFQLDATWKWIVAILAFEPIVEMLIADLYHLLKRKL